MKRQFLLMATLLFCLPLFAQAQTSSGANSEEGAIRRAVETYLNKTSGVRNVLHPGAKIISTDGAGTRLIETSLHKPYKAKKGEVVRESRQQIVAVDAAGSGATVKVSTEFAAGADLPPVEPRTHFQYISLLKIGGEWKIVSILMPPLRFGEGAGK